jgi:1,4-alpha-glucan branching enzyme
MYAHSENFILPLSHDEVVHGKKSLLEKMTGDDWQKFANLRLLLLYLYLHPGKKLLFMGAEFGQRSEWYCKQSLDWHLLDMGDHHRQTQDFIRQLNELYKQHPPLWQLDYDHRGFDWLDLEDQDNSIISFTRKSDNPADHLVCLLNFTPQTLENYKIGLPEYREYELLFCSDSAVFGGSGACPDLRLKPIEEPFARAPYHCLTRVPPLAGLVFKPVSKESQA